MSVNTINVGNIPNGSRELTLNRPSAAPVAQFTLLAEDFTHNIPTTEIQRRDAKNQPSGFVRNRDFGTGTATLQVIISGAAELRAKVGDWFKEDTDPITGDDLFWAVVDAPGAAENQAQDKKQSITFELIPDPAAYYVNIAGVLTLVPLA